MLYFAPYLRTILGRYPALYFGVHTLTRRHQHLIIGSDTEIVIEGFPRSANTFAVVAFEHAQRRHVSIAHHLHAPAQVLRAVALDIPAIVLIREPVAAVISLLIRDPRLSAYQAVLDYVSFYSSIVRIRDRFVVGDFADVTKNYGAVIERVNQLFGTDFYIFEHTEVAIERVFHKLEKLEIMEAGDVAENKVARPSAERNKLKMVQKVRLEEPRLVRLIGEAQDLYLELTLKKDQQ